MLIWLWRESGRDALHMECGVVDALMLEGGTRALIMIFIRYIRYGDLNQWGSRASYGQMAGRPSSILHTCC